MTRTIRNIAKLSILTGLFTAAIGQSNGQTADIPGFTGSPPSDASIEDIEQWRADTRGERLAWFEDSRFGMFIHWGVYSHLGGFYKGKETPFRYASHIMRSLNIPVEEYEQVAREFNPVDFDAEEWVQIAKDAGMKYIVITAKHHDGFSMYDSDASEYNIVDWTPFARDPLQELKEACDKHGLIFSVYYSHWDWHFDADKNEKFDNYNQFRMAQIGELVEKYEVPLIWFDDFRAKGNQELLHFIYRNYPQLIVNERVTSRGRGDGDFVNREQKTSINSDDAIWESCITLSSSWGYYRGKPRKSAERVVREMVKVVSQGGNFLLNIGPDGKGRIVADAVERLKKVGDWMDANGESIYGCGRADSVPKPGWGYVTQKNTDEGRILYLHFLNRPRSAELQLDEGFQGEIKRAYILSDSDRKTVEVERIDDRLVIQLPDELPDPINTVVAVEITH